MAKAGPTCSKPSAVRDDVGVAISGASEARDINNGSCGEQNKVTSINESVTGLSGQICKSLGIVQRFPQAVK